MESRSDSRPARAARPAPGRRRLLAATLVCAAAAAGCVETVTYEEPSSPEEIAVNQSRSVELEFLRFDAKRFAKTLTLADLKDIPRSTLEQTWLLDLDMTALIQNALLKLAYTPPEQIAAMPRPAQNLLGLLNMTPESANLSGTSLESLLGVGNAVGISPSKILADLVGVGGNDTLIDNAVTAQAVMENLVSTHPATQTRNGPVTHENPTGIYPVAPHSIPVNLYDVVSDFAGLADRYGPAPLDPANPDGPKHPGFIKKSSGVKAARDDFSMTVRVNVNALPYKGIDATSASAAGINSTPGQVEGMFDFSDPDWLQLTGLAANLTIDELTMGIQENPAYLPGGTSREPAPFGNSPAWDTPSWEFEHILASAGQLRASAIDAHCTPYAPSGTVQPPFEAVKVCIDETGWTEITVDPSVILDEPPPAPSYFWDILTEVTQRRLHDGGLGEGEADLTLTVRDVPVGVKTDDLVASIKENLAKDPRSLKDMSVELNDNAAGDADFYYYQPSSESGVAGPDDYLYFVAPEDIRKDEGGVRVREYSYKNPGFFSDAGLTQKLSSTELIDDDNLREKVKIEPGKTVYMEDDAGRRYEIKVGEKPSPHRVSLTLTRIQ